VSLRVASRTGDPTANAYVALIPESAASEADIAASMIFGQTDQNGYYFAGAVPPGRYRILATNDPIDGAVCKLWGWPTDLAANLVSRLRDVRGRGQAVDIRPNSTVHLTLAPQSLQ
jgi:hypothetical protein